MEANINKYEFRSNFSRTKLGTKTVFFRYYIERRHEIPERPFDPSPEHLYQSKETGRLIQAALAKLP
jgi:hypothetical protein